MTITNGVEPKDHGVPRSWEDLRDFVLVSDGGKWWLGRPTDRPGVGPGAAPLPGPGRFTNVCVGNPVRLSPAFELSDDDLWMQTQERPDVPPEKHYQGRRRALVPACGFFSGYVYECEVRGLFRLEQLDESELRHLFGAWIVPVERVRDALRKVVTRVTSGITVADSLRGLPPPPKG